MVSFRIYELCRHRSGQGISSHVLFFRTEISQEVTLDMKLSFDMHFRGGFGGHLSDTRGTGLIRAVPRTSFLGVPLKVDNMVFTCRGRIELGLESERESLICLCQSLLFWWLYDIMID
jgi:hypothetical protein